METRCVWSVVWGVEKSVALVGALAELLEVKRETDSLAGSSKAEGRSVILASQDRTQFRTYQRVTKMRSGCVG